MDSTDRAQEPELKDDREDMNEADFEDFLAGAIELYAEEIDVPPVRVRSFSEVGMLTYNKGLVVRVGDSEFQVTIVPLRR